MSAAAHTHSHLRCSWRVLLSGRLMPTPNDWALIYLLHRPVTQAHLWAIARLRTGVGPARLFLNVDVGPGEAARADIRTAWKFFYPDNATSVRLLSEATGLDASHVVLCGWNASMEALSPTTLRGYPRLSGHKLTEPMLACWCATFCSRFRHVWVLEKDTAFMGDTGAFFAQHANNTNDLLSHDVRYVGAEWWAYYERDNASLLTNSSSPVRDLTRTDVMRRSRRRREPTRMQSGQPTGIVFYEPQVRRLSTALLRHALDVLRAGHFAYSEVLASTLCARSSGCTLGSWASNASLPDAHCYRYLIKAKIAIRGPGEPNASYYNAWRAALVKSSGSKLSARQLSARSHLSRLGSWCAPREVAGDCSQRWVHPLLELKFPVVGFRYSEAILWKTMPHLRKRAMQAVAGATAGHAERRSAAVLTASQAGFWWGALMDDDVNDGLGSSVAKELFCLTNGSAPRIVLW